ncbi:hypothetical protein AB6C54_10160 [Vibrio splendidus]
MKKINRVIIATLPNGAFGNAGQTWKNIDFNSLKSKLESKNLDVIYCSVTALLSLDLSFNDIVIYTSSDEPNVRSYLKDVMYLVSKKSVIVPSYESLLAHENKGFQQIYRDEYNFGGLCGGYSFDSDDLPKEYPFVYKKVTGAGSSGVSLVRSKKDYLKIRNRDFRVSFKRKVIKYLRKVKLSAIEYLLYSYRHKGFNLFVHQDFVDNLDHDFKVLVFSGRYYVLKRSVKENDFRASGSGLLAFETAPLSVLNFSKEIFEVLDVPVASLDIAEQIEGCKLIEYQMLNFGPYALNNSPGFYTFENDEWKFNDGSSDLNFNYSLAYESYIMKIVNNDN